MRNAMTQDELNEALLEAATSRHIKRIGALIKKGAQIDAADDMGRRPLHWAAWHADKEMAELLLASGAQICAVNNDGKQPLHEAVWRGHGEMAGFLIGKGAQICAADKEGRQPLHVAVRMGDKEMVALLIAKDAPVDAVGWNGERPLHVAARQGYGGKEVVKLLLGHGADPVDLNDEGKTPRECCMDCKENEEVRRLLEVDRKILARVKLEWDESRIHEALAAIRARQRQFGSLRRKGPTI